MRRRLALLWTSTALLCCGGRTLPDQTSVPTVGGLQLSATDTISIRDVAVSDDGRVAIVGFYNGRADLSALGAELPPSTSDDGFIAVLDEHARALWTEPLPGTGAQGFTGVAFTPTGDVVAQGSGDNQHEGATAQYPDGTAWLMRFDRQGAVRLRKGFSGDRTQPTRVAADSQNALIAVGNFNGQLDFYGPQTSAPPYLLKLDASGNLAWLQHVPTEGDARGVSRLAVAAAADDSLFVSGRGEDDYAYGFVSKWTSAGEQLWSRSFREGPSGGSVAVSDLAVDHAGNAIIAGDYSGDVVTDGGGLPPTATEREAMWLAKLSPDGGVLWMRSLPGVDILDPRAPCAVAVDAQDRIWLAGTASELDFAGKQLEPRQLPSGVAFVLEITADGDELAAHTSDAEAMTFYGLAVAPSGTVWAGGDFVETAELSGKRVTVNHGLNAFLFSLAPSGAQQ